MKTYKDAGVNIDLADRFVKEVIQPRAERTHKYWKGEVAPGLGGFGALLRIPLVISATMDGVGSKMLIANVLDQTFVGGHDVVAMNANDLSVRMEPTSAFFLNYYGVDKISLCYGGQVMDGIEQGCRLANMALVAGETEEMPIRLDESAPDMYTRRKLKLMGAAVGIALSSDAEMDPKRDIRAGMGIFGYRSNGVHANGFTLIHRAFKLDYTYPNNVLKKLHTHYEEIEHTLAEELMKPTTIYTDTMRHLRRKRNIAGFAHVTGGGLLKRIPKILPSDCDAILNVGSWTQPPIFDLIAKAGNISQKEMLKTFNCGIGLIAISNDDLTMEDWYHIGDVVPGEGTLTVNCK